MPTKVTFAITPACYPHLSASGSMKVCVRTDRAAEFIALLSPRMSVSVARGLGVLDSGTEAWSDRVGELVQATRLMINAGIVPI